MPEYIERKQILDYIAKKKTKMIPFADGTHGVSLEAVETVIKVFSAADVVPVVHGRWTNSNNVYECSNCGYSFEHEGYIAFFNYCPNCGAKMDRKEE